MNIRLKCFCFFAIMFFPLTSYSANIITCVLENESNCVKCTQGQNKVREVKLAKNDIVEFTTEQPSIKMNPSVCTRYTSDQACPLNDSKKSTCARYKISSPAENKEAASYQVIVSFSVPNDDCKSAKVELNNKTVVSFQNVSEQSQEIKLPDLKFNCKPKKSAS